MSERWYLRAQELYGKELRWQTEVLDEVRIRSGRKDVTKMNDGELALTAIQAKMDVDVADWERTQAATNLEIARKCSEPKVGLTPLLCPGCNKSPTIQVDGSGWAVLCGCKGGLVEYGCLKDEAIDNWNKVVRRRLEKKAER